MAGGSKADALGGESRIGFNRIKGIEPRGDQDCNTLLILISVSIYKKSFSAMSVITVPRHEKSN